MKKGMNKVRGKSKAPEPKPIILQQALDEVEITSTDSPAISGRKSPAQLIASSIFGKYSLLEKKANR
jgi:hypothetical protein